MGSFGPKNTSFWDLIEYQCNMRKLEWCQNVPKVCGNLLIYGLYEVLHVSDALLINYNSFEPRNTSFWDLTEYQCNTRKLEWCPNVPKVSTNLLIYGL